MRKKYRNQIEQYVKQNHRRSAWRKFVRVMACIVVFCTTYALILPAITMEQTHNCGLQAHSHGEDCYETVEIRDLICAETDPAHVHEDGCYSVAQQEQCICSLEAHEHTDQCMSDPNADRETEADWLTTMDRVTLTGSWAEDLANIAASQIGYRESENNYQLLESQGIRGYTRYGAWYGIPYGKWDAMFVRFCMHYAGIPENALSFDANTTDWFESLASDGQIRTLEEGEPIPGDLVFFADETQTVTGAAVVTAVENGMLTVVEGDKENQVMEHKVSLSGGDAPVGFVSIGALQAGGVTTPVLSVEEPEDPTDAAEPVDSAGQPTFLNENVAMAAAGYSLTTVNPANLQTGVDYIIYAQGNSGNQHILLGSDNNITPIQATSTYWTSPYSINSNWQLTPDQVDNVAWEEFTWQVVKQNNQTYLVSKATGQRLTLTYSGLSMSPGGTGLGFRTDGAATEINGGDPWLQYNYNDWVRGWYNGTDVYFARITGAEANYPDAVKTGDVHINRLRFFNICENGDEGVSALAGCVFEITGENGYKATVTSENDPEVSLPKDIPDGTYTITEISAPPGYIRDTEHTRTFTIRNGTLASDATIGTFINHNMQQLNAGKNAEVEDYANRIYQVNMTADSHVRMYEMEPMDLLFVVDQSNSMLFPSGLKDTGKRVTLSKSGSNNTKNLDALNLDKSKMHYVIADPQGTSTVWAVWHDGSAWLCQDASYYAKAKFNNDPGYQDDNETVIFPENRSYADQRNAEPTGTRSNGCGIGFDLGTSSLGNYINNQGGSKEFVVYQAMDEYNRLHYLEEALANLIYEMADVNDKNRITLTRFSRTVDEEHCIGPEELNPDNADMLVEAVSSIKTSGGTRQDRALEHIYTMHLNDSNDHYKDFAHNYTLLITDGAPVRSGDDEPSNVGGPNDPANKNGNTIYSRIKGYAADVRGKSHLMTVALGMEGVEAGKQVLEEIATDDSFYCALDDASQLLQFVQKLLFESFRPKEELTIHGDITDEISDSFYPIAWVTPGSGTGRPVLVSGTDRDWILLKSGDWITLDGKLTTAGAADAAGQLLRKEDGTFYVNWTNQNLTNGWKGTVYVKAKEDFIGGNAIDTNKDAFVTANEGTVHLDTPTVNVRLLNMNHFRSEVAVYLGDLINGGSSPISVLREYYQDIRFEKLIADGTDVLNKNVADTGDGLEVDAFSLKYAIGRELTDDEWAYLMEDEDHELVFPYLYDDASSHGAVGTFTVRLQKTGEPADYQEHTATEACHPRGQPSVANCSHPVETYTLSVVYDAHRLGDGGRPPGNVNNAPGSPGAEVGTGTTLPTGLGIVESVNVHEVHVISGEIEIYKIIQETLRSDVPQTFSFTLHRVEDGEDTSHDVTRTITVNPGQTQGSATIRFTDLRRGSYTVTEAVGETYALKQIQVGSETNAQSDPPIGGTAQTVTFVMGNNTSGANVIGLDDPEDRFTDYVDHPNGVYGEAYFTNGPLIFTGEIPVQKIWDDGADAHTRDAVYVLLLKDGHPVLDDQNRGRLLKLDASNNWQGVFTVVLANKDDSVSNYNYSVREVANVSESELNDWHPAILENDGETVLYYDRALDEGGLIGIDGKGYLVEYSTGADGTRIVTNYKSFDLPETGGIGTYPYTIGGLTAIAAALVYGYLLRRKRERGASG